MIRLDLIWLNSRCISWGLLKTLLPKQTACGCSNNVTGMKFSLHIISENNLDIQKVLFVMLSMLNLYCSNNLYSKGPFASNNGHYQVT